MYDLVSESKRAVVHLEERRTALVYAAFSCQFDVCNLAKRNPAALPPGADRISITTHL